MACEYGREGCLLGMMVMPCTDKIENAGLQYNGCSGVMLLVSGKISMGKISTIKVPSKWVAYNTSYACTSSIL